MKIAIFGLSITSSWGNGHATTYRGLVRELSKRGHEIVFLERDVPWYAQNRDLEVQGFGAELILYESLDDLDVYSSLVQEADAVVVGSYVPEGKHVMDWVLRHAKGVTAFYDIDTPVTLARLEEGDCGYLSAEGIPKFDLYLSFTGGRTLKRLEHVYGARSARAFYCSVDPDLYYPMILPKRWDLGYLGTYSEDRQPTMRELLIHAAEWIKTKSFIVAGPLYPETIRWPENVERLEHLAPGEHREFYNSQRFALNITRSDMIAAGYSPSVRLFEAAACGTPIISDWWEGLDDFFEIGSELLIAEDTEQVCDLLNGLSPREALKIGMAGRRKVLSRHTAAHRALEFEKYIAEVHERNVLHLST
jgi:spore maturation protein CgeB